LSCLVAADAEKLNLLDCTICPLARRVFISSFYLCPFISMLLVSFHFALLFGLRRYTDNSRVITMTANILDCVDIYFCPGSGWMRDLELSFDFMFLSLLRVCSCGVDRVVFMRFFGPILHLPIAYN